MIRERTPDQRSSRFQIMDRPLNYGGVFRCPASRRGNVMVFIVFSAVAMLFFGAMAINFVSFDFSEEKLQHAADAAAISAAYAVLLDDDELVPATIADRLAQDFRIANKNQKIESSDIVFGRCAQDIDGKFVFQADETPFNATRVIARRSSGHAAGALPVFFGSLLGLSSINMQCSATAVYLEQDFGIVVDASGFMHGPDRFDEAARAFDVIMDTLEGRTEKTRVSLTVFSKDGDTVVPITDDYAAVRAAFDDIQLRGPRDIQGGLIEGLRSLFTGSGVRDDAMKDMILLSECKDTSSFSSGDLAQLITDLGARVHVFTFSNQADSDIASAIANGTGGTYTHKATNSQLSTFVDDLLDNGGVFLCQ